MRVLQLVLLAILVAGCGSGSRPADDVADASAPMAEATKAEAPQVAAGVAKLASQTTPVAPHLVIRDAELTLRVRKVEEAERQVGSVARALGGDVEASQGGDLAGPNPTMSVTLRVPETRFDDALAQLERLGTRLGKTVSTEDVSAQAVDLDARTRSLRVQEDAYRAILGNARRVADVLEVQERLTGVRTQIEQIVAQRRSLGDQAARSKIVVTIQQAATPTAPAPDPDWIAQTWGDATGTLRSLGRGLASLGLWLIALLPVWLPVALVGTFVVRRARQRKIPA